MVIVIVNKLEIFFVLPFPISSVSGFPSEFLARLQGRVDIWKRIVQDKGLSVILRQVMGNVYEFQRPFCQVGCEVGKLDWLFRDGLAAVKVSFHQGTVQVLLHVQASAPPINE